jgi:hypothetical protein
MSYTSLKRCSTLQGHAILTAFHSMHACTCDTLVTQHNAKECLVPAEQCRGAVQVQ